MLTTQELEDIKDYVLRELPRVLEEDPGFVVFIEGILSEKFPRRDEFARLLDEFTGFRAEQRQRFDEVDERFERIDQRFDEVDERFEQIDQRLERIDQRFEQIDQRFEAIDQRFEAVDQRFEQMDHRFEQMDQNFKDLRDWVEMVVGRFQVRSGRRLEDVVAGALRLGLSRADIRPEAVQLRQKISDPQGLVYKPGQQKEVDLVAQDDELLVFEVKTAPEVEDVDYFADKVELVRWQNPDKQVQGVLITLEPSDEVRQQCAQRGLQLIP